MALTTETHKTKKPLLYLPAKCDTFHPPPLTSKFNSHLRCKGVQEISGSQFHQYPSLHCQQLSTKCSICIYFPSSIFTLLNLRHQDAFPRTPLPTPSKKKKKTHTHRTLWLPINLKVKATKFGLYPPPASSCTTLPFILCPGHNGLFVPFTHFPRICHRTSAHAALDGTFCLPCFTQLIIILPWGYQFRHIFLTEAVLFIQALINTRYLS